MICRRTPCAWNSTQRVTAECGVGTCARTMDRVDKQAPVLHRGGACRPLIFGWHQRCACYAPHSCYLQTDRVLVAVILCRMLFCVTLRLFVATLLACATLAFSAFALFPPCITIPALLALPCVVPPALPSRALHTMQCARLHCPMYSY